MSEKKIGAYDIIGISETDAEQASGDEQEAAAHNLDNTQLPWEADHGREETLEQVDEALASYDKEHAAADNLEDAAPPHARKDDEPDQGEPYMKLSDEATVTERPASQGEGKEAHFDFRHTPGRETDANRAAEESGETSASDDAEARREATDDTVTTDRPGDNPQMAEGSKTIVENAPKPPDLALKYHPGLGRKVESPEEEAASSTERLRRLKDLAEAFKDAVSGGRPDFAGALKDLIEGYGKTIFDASDIPNFRGQIEGYSDGLARWATGESAENLPNVPEDVQRNWSVAVDELTKGYREGANRAQEAIEDMSPEQAEAFREYLRDEFSGETGIDRGDIREGITDYIRENADPETQRLMQGM